MNAISKVISNFIHDEEGTELVEWGLIAGLVITISAAAFIVIGGNLNTIFTALQAQTTTAAGGGGGGG